MTVPIRYTVVVGSKLHWWTNCFFLSCRRDCAVLGTAAASGAGGADGGRRRWFLTGGRTGILLRGWIVVKEARESQ